MAVLPSEYNQKKKILNSNTKARCGQISVHGKHRYTYQNNRKFSSNGKIIQVQCLMNVQFCIFQSKYFIQALLFGIVLYVRFHLKSNIA